MGHLNTQETDAGGCWEFKANLAYMVNCRPANATFEVLLKTGDVT